MGALIGTLAVAGVLSFTLTGLFTAHARRTGRLDRPGARSSHATPTPTGAGLGVILALMLTAALAAVLDDGAGSGVSTEWWLAGGALLLSALGFRDDAVGVPAGLRLLVQVLAASALAVALGVTDVLWIALLVLWLTWTMNAFNFMDGSDGMAGVQGAFSGLLLAWAFLREPGAEGMAIMAAAVAGVCAGFLPWNLPTARVFMGDAGSVPLGWLISGLAVAGAVGGIIAWPLVLLVLAPFYVDAGLTLLARIRRGERWYTAHRTHVYQRLIAQGWTHGQVLLAYTALNLTIVAPAALLGMNRPDWAWWLAAGALGLIAAGWCIVSLKLGKRP